MRAVHDAYSGPTPINHENCWKITNLADTPQSENDQAEVGGEPLVLRCAVCTVDEQLWLEDWTCGRV